MTGFTGLLAEQGFEKYIALLVGVTASASAVVLFTYFLGFALGGVAAGRWLKSGRTARPLVVYGAVELLVGVSCVAFSYWFHPLIETMAPLQNLLGPAWKMQARFLCGCLLVLPTAALMGASFPLIAQAIDNRDGDDTGRKRWSHVYCANLAGACLAALAAPFLILPIIGLRGAMWLCFGITTAVAILAAALPQPGGARESTAVSTRQPLSREIRLLLAASFASGAIFFALEVIWTHLIAVAIGCSIYAFSWMLAAVLLGLLLGAVQVNRSGSRGRTASAALLFQGCAILMLLQFRLWDRAPGVFNIVPPPAFQNNFYFAECFKLYVTMVLLLPQATVLGLIYPRLLRSPQLEGERNSYLAGYLSAANSLGCLSGALLGIFVLVPGLGSEVSLKLIIAVLAAFWLLFLQREKPTRMRLARAALIAVAIVGLTLWWQWDWGALTSGRGNYFGQAPRKAAADSGVKFLPAKFIFEHEDAQGGFTTVVEQTALKPEGAHTIRTLYTNGKFQGSDDSVVGEGLAQFGFSAIPSLFVRHFDRALLIGLGTGHSATALRTLGYREIHVAEFSPGIVEAAKERFSRLNESVLSDPRVRLHLEDGRNVLLTDPKTRYDLITIEITSVWFAGATNLYSTEFYELARKRLNPDGVLQQWVQLHHVSPREIASELATAAAVFPHVGLWYYGSQGMLVAANHPLELQRDGSIEQRFQGADRMTPEHAAKLVDELYGSRLAASEGIARLIHDTRPTINTDHNRWIEYSTPRYQSSSYDWITHNMKFLAQYR